MKLVRYGQKGSEKPGAIDAQGNLRDLSLLVDDFSPEWLTPGKLQALKAIDLEQMPLVSEPVRFGVPIAGVRQFVAIGLNYKKHAEESGLPIPEEPVVFTKAITSLSGANDDIVMPENAQELDWEIELGIVMGSVANKIDEASALDFVAGYCLANDVSERHWQIKRNGQWGKGKSFETFGPLGPWLVTKDEVPNPHALEMTLKVNGEIRQQSNTADMIFPVATIVSYLSQFMTLLPGDVVITGTPQGVGLGMKPPRFLARGDVMTLSIDKLGTQTQRVI
ncbi:2-hydroxyhepta-2,4-diene-1,7-dioate isomerase [Pusillimonas sp. T2]|uniref:fumarylacetoacetate hydrolase family protein n=1 Tax=Pusillimonas sp. T2 TaxID=1548123 RepID=UPI000B8AE4C9|nr:fumarylacetoacetate hydrolase family protein [Pusillimonas sp. T2]OXR47912.1 2-hydroxyhepta-2,4-diene-1,7-dioate isomerase [Pusillimonas sp. T2]